MTQRRQFCPRNHDTFQVGRDSSYRCRRCKAEDAVAAKKARDAEAQAIRSAELRQTQAENDRRREREYRRAIKAGGDVAAEARWQRLSVETLISTESRYDLCQWALEDGNPGACTRRTQDVYCHVHNRQLERESKRREKQKAIERAPDSPKPRAPRKPRSPRRVQSGGSGWARYKADRPERARLYKSSAWTSARDRQLREFPLCAVCGAKASVVDHIHNRAEGGAGLDPSNFQSMCKRCHKAKTIEESHRGRKRAAEERRRGRP